MCTKYSGNLKDIIIMPIDIYYSKLCQSYDRTSLILITLVRIYLYITIYYYVEQYLKKELLENTFEYVDNFLIAIILSNVLSLSVALSRVPNM